MPPLRGRVALLAALYLCFGLGNGATFQLVPHRWQGKTGLMTGIIGAAGGIGGFYLPVVMGIAKESTGSYQLGFMTFGMLAALAFVLVVVLHQQWLAWSAPATSCRGWHSTPPSARSDANEARRHRQRHGRAAAAGAAQAARIVELESHGAVRGAAPGLRSGAADALTSPARARDDLSLGRTGRFSIERASISDSAERAVGYRSGAALHASERRPRLIRTTIAWCSPRAPIPSCRRYRGATGPGRFVYRTIEDLDAIRSASAAAKSGVVIGGGLLGLEAAKALKDLGLETHVVEFAPRLMAVQIDDAGGGMLRERIRELGVGIHTGKQTVEITDGSERIASSAICRRQRSSRPI